MKMSVWSLACQQGVFQRHHSGKHLPEFYLQDGGESQLAVKLRHCHPVYTFSTSLCWASTRHHATRICCSAPARLQLPTDICRKRSRSAANQPHAAAAIDRRDRQTDTWPLYGPCSAYHASIVINGNNVRSYKYRITSSHLPSNTSPCNQLCLHHWIRTKVNFFYKRLRIGHTPVTHSSFIDRPYWFPQRVVTAIDSFLLSIS